MNSSKLTRKQIEQIKEFQRNEITEYHIYNRLSGKIKNKKNSEVLEKIAREELAHYRFWKTYTGSEIKPSGIKLFIYYLLARILGLTFGVRLMERGEEQANQNYSNFTHIIPEAADIAKEEDAHEQLLIKMIQEEKLKYIGSVVLGLNDALVELTGALAGFSFALQNTRVIALVGLITGIAASLSMAASEYLSNKAEESGSKAVVAALYTGLAYVFTVIILILPYFLFAHYLVCLAITILLAIVIIFLFNFYISVAKDYNFGKRFVEMLVISLGVTFISFWIGFLIRNVFGIEV